MGERERCIDYNARLVIVLLFLLTSVILFLIRSRDLGEKGDLDRRLTALEAAQKK